MKNLINHLFKGIVLGLGFSILAYFSTRYSEITFWSLASISVLFLLYLFLESKNQERTSIPPNNMPYVLSSHGENKNGGCSLLIAVLLLILMIPAIFFTWILNPEEKVKSIKLTVFIISLICSIIYYILNRDRFKSPADFVSFFSGTLIGPVGVIELFL